MAATDQPRPVIKVKIFNKSREDLRLKMSKYLSPIFRNHFNGFKKVMYVLKAFVTSNL